MANYGITDNCLNLIQDIYKKSECAVKIGGATTHAFKFTKGVRQGCPMSPYLFNLFIDEIFDIVDQGVESNIFLKEGENKLSYVR